MSEYTDIAGLGLLIRTYPAEVVDTAIASCGRTEQRRRLLSARLMVYFVLAMALFSPAPYLDVMRRLTSGLRWGGLWGEEQMPSKASIFQARERLGSGPLNALFRATMRPLATAEDRDSHWRRRRLLLVEEHLLALAEGVGQTPRLRVSGLVESGTGAVLDAVWTAPESARTLLRSTEPGTVLLADGLPLDADLALAAVASGVDLVWRPQAVRLPVQPQQLLPDGSFLFGWRGLPLRVIAPDVVTTLLDPFAAPAAELLELHHRAAGSSGSLRDALLGAEPGSGPVASRTTDGIHQEIYGRLLVHYAMRQSMQYAHSTPVRHEPSRMPEFAR